MKPEKIITALNDIDGQFIHEAHETASAPRKATRRFTVLIAAVIALMAIAVTAFASEEIVGWFKLYFQKHADTPLTSEQIEYIEDNEQLIEEMQTNNGWTVELRSVLSGGNTTYATIGVTAPHTINLNALNLYFGKGIEIFDSQNQPPFSYWFSKEDDLDGLSNTINLVIIFEPGHWNTSSLWNINISALHQLIYDAAYEEELLQTKYAGQADVMFSSEETERIYQHPVLAEGPWSFTIDLNACERAELEMITEPVAIQAEVRRKGSDDITSDDYFIDTVEEVSIVSFILSPLNATIHYECAAEDAFVNAYAWELYVVMKDGSQVELQRGNSSQQGVSNYLAASPIVLDEVDHILLADGTKIMAP